MYFDPLYLLIFFGTMALSVYASWRVKSAYARYSQVPALSGLSGAQIAQRILDLNGIRDVTIHAVRGQLSDHYDPSNKQLMLSEENYYGTNVAALGVAAHECGHAIQHQQLYAPLQWRMAAVGITTIAGQIIPFMGMGLLWLMPRIALPVLAVCFGIVMVFQLITLPVEFDATARAKRVLASTGAVAPGAETAAMSSVLDAAALTYVAAFISALGQFLYYVMIMLGGRRND
ncbi:zinc metallopeptidase [Prosthecobacter sp.]|uniref:zinc metallopeptidase n=1 Tax=Prosthecobacter sp. TaxID=1965333 RepID=UPI003784B0DF